MINNIKTFRFMKLAQALKALFVTVAGIGIIGLIIYFYCVSKTEQTGYYTAQDTLDAYNHGAENMRQALKKEAQDLTVKSCQE